MKVDHKVAQVAQEEKVARTRKHTEVTVYKEPGCEAYYYRVRIHGKRFKRSTGQTTRAAALAQAKIIAAQLRAGSDARETMKRPGYATVAEVARVWLECSEAKTRANNVSALKKFVRSFVDGDPDNVQMVRVTAKELRNYLAKWPGSPEGRKSTAGQILAMFSPAAMDWYKDAGLVLPDVKELRKCRSKRKAREEGFRGFTLIPAPVLREMEAEAEQLRRSDNIEDRRVWATFALMRWCGLRNIEVAELRRDWIVKGSRSPLIRIVNQELSDGARYQPKGRSGTVPIRLRLVAQLRRAFGRDGEHVIPRENKTDAYVLTHKTINAWARKFLPDGNKCAYRLRGQYGAEIAMRDGIEVASRLLRHTDIKTTWNHYHDLVDEPAPL